VTWVEFDGFIEPMEWGRSTYTVIRVPSDCVVALEVRGRRVEGLIDDVPVNLALTRSPAIDGVFLWAGKSLLRRLRVVAGDSVHVRLRPADPDAVSVPDDVASALESSSSQGRWGQLTPGRRRALLARVDSAATRRTRARRIDELIRTTRR
jgi:hypothetical protein